VLVCSYRQASTSGTVAIQEMVRHSRAAGLDVECRVHGNALVHQSRNKALASVRDDADFILFVDDDMVPSTEALTTMVGLNLPVVSALCTTRIPPVELAARLYDEQTHQFLNLRVMKKKLHTGKFAVGMAFGLIRRDAADAAINDYLEANDWLALRKREHDRMHVRNERREEERKRRSAIRKALWARDRYLRVFDFPVIDSEEQLGEDIAFSYTMLRLGINVSIDARIPVGHLGEHAYGPWDIDEEAIRKELEAVA